MSRRLLTCVALAVCGAAGAAASTAAAATSTFGFTGSEQAYQVPKGVHHVLVTATGAAGGGPTAIDPAWGYFFPGGRAAVVSAFVRVSPGQPLYVDVGGVGGKPAGGFNGGGTAGRFVYSPSFELSSYGGGGATDLRTLPRSDTNSLMSRLLVAAGGGGSAHPGARAGDAGQPGQGATQAGGGAGTEPSGGAAGCAPGPVGCGTAGTLGIGGNGGISSAGYEGAGGGGGLYGGGGGAGDPTGLGGGGGGSSLVPAHGTLGLAASFATPPGATIETARCVRRLSGNSTGVTTADYVTGAATAESSGTLSHLGAFTSSASGTLGGNGAPFFTATQTLVAANGDKLFGTISGEGVIGTGTVTGTNVVTITGGTGRFADAIGSYQETYSGSLTFPGNHIATVTATSTIDGQISYCRAHRHDHR